MLIEFRVENHRSLRDEQALTMESGRLGDDSDPRPRIVPGFEGALLPLAVLYGANASGKSNVLSALTFMRDAVCDSHRAWSPDEGIPRDQFAWGDKQGATSFFEASILVKGTKYTYGFVASSEKFIEEWLYAWPNNHKQTWFTRDENSFSFSPQLKGENKLIEEVTRPNALFLSTAVQNKHVQLSPIFTWFRMMQPINIGQRRPYGLPRAMLSDMKIAKLLEEESSDPRQQLLFEDPQSDHLSVQFRKLLQAADIGILDVRVEKSDQDERRSPWRYRRFSLKHRCAISDAWLPLEEESKGTQTLFRMAYPILEAMRFGAIVVIDELEASLHPTLALEIVRQFNDPITNPNNAQLIFTTHDTNLLGNVLGEPAVRRDQVWLTEKSPEGATVLYPLTNFHPRKSENIERGYLQGRYGAIPFLGEFLLGPE